MVQTDGKLVAAGTAGVPAAIGETDFGLARYHPNGSLDASFGTAGTVATDFFGQSDQVNALVRAGSKLLVAGSASRQGFSDFALARYRSDGSLDATFGTGGTVTTNVGLDDVVRALIVQADGKVVAAGVTRDFLTYPFVTSFAVVRYQANGTVDTSFGVNGTAIVDLGGERTEVTALVAQRDKLVVAGSASTEMRQSFALARYRHDGRLDTSFGHGGSVTTDFADTTARLQTLIVRDGKLIAAGAADIGSSFDFALARYHGDGTLDSRFGDAGTLTTDFVGNFDEINALAWHTDGKLVAAGTSYPANINDFGDFALARYHTK